MNYMDNKRETVSLTTTNGHVVVLKSFLTGREANAIKQVVFSKMTYSGTPGEATKPIAFTGELVLEQELANIDATVISVDDNTAPKASDLVQDLPVADYQEVVDKANELTKDLFSKPPVEN